MGLLLQAQVIAAFGRHLIVRDPAGNEHRARVFGRKLVVVCGDEVLCEMDERSREVHVVEVRPRRSALHRTSGRGDAEPIVANITRLLVVLAPLPTPDLFIVDRYLAAATSANIAASLILNKIELGIQESLRSEIVALVEAGYDYIEASMRTHRGIEEILQTCANSVAVLVGQSGVGKSSIVRRLVPESEAPTGELMREEEGRHTTTASRMFDLPSGGHLIDSPGVRDFAPALDSLEPSSLGFIEVARLAPECRFLDCLHMREPHCAVRAAAGTTKLNARRYESYRRLRMLRESLTSERYAGRKPKSAK